MESYDQNLPPEAYQEVVKKIEQEDAQEAIALPSISDAALARAEQSVNNLVKAMAISLRATNKNDWVDLGGKAYLQETGVMKVARVWGVSFTGNQLTRILEDVGGTQVIRYVAQCTASMDGRSVEADGLASSDDDFFTHGGKLPLGEVDLNSVRKKAMTNAQSRALKKLLGLGGMTWEDVNAATGNRGGTMGKVDYAASKAKREDTTGQAGGDPRLVLWNVCCAMAELDSTKPETVLETFSQFTSKKDGKIVALRSRDALNKASPQWVEGILERAQKAYNAHPGRGGGWQEEPGANG